MFVTVARPQARFPRTGAATLEACVAAALLGVIASANLSATASAQREATLSTLRQHALALAADRLDLRAGGLAPDDPVWQTRVAIALPGGEGAVFGDADGIRVQVRWRAPGQDEPRCPGSTCVELRIRP